MTPFTFTRIALTLLAAGTLTALSSCGGSQPAEQEKAPTAEANNLTTSARFAYPLPASVGNFIIGTPPACTLQVNQGGNTVKNFLSADLPLKVTVSSVQGVDSLVFNTQNDGGYKSLIAFSLSEASNFSSYVIKYVSQAGGTGGIGTIDERDMNRMYFTNAQTCGLSLNWDADSLYVYTANSNCTCYRDSTFGASPAALTATYDQCDW